MKVSWQILLVIVLETACVAGYAEGSMDLSIGSKSYSMSPITTNWLNRSVYGVYRRYLDMSAGIDLHLFPDGTFAWVKWSDIGGKKLVGQGTSKFQNGVLTLRHIFVAEPYGAQFSDIACHVFGGREQGEGDGEFTIVLVDGVTLQHGTTKLDALKCRFRILEYTDWQAIKKDLEAKRSEVGKEGTLGNAHDKRDHDGIVPDPTREVGR